LRDPSPPSDGIAPAEETGPVEAAASPVRGDEPENLEPGTALCLSGGGYRAMLFHVGAIWRLNELGYLPRLNRISSVSGGSITNGVLALNWPKLRYDDGVATNLDELFVRPLRHLAGKTIDKGAVFKGILLPGTISERVAGAYRQHVFGKWRLKDLPDEPRFIFNATNMQTGSLWRFSKPYMADYRVGVVPRPEVDLATAVAASSAFPPILSPVELDIDPGDWDPATKAPLHEPPYTTKPVLSDGGVYDNLGLETAWKGHRTILISDGGGRLGAKPRPRALWPLQVYRVLSVIDNQVRSLRKRQAISAFEGDLRDGVYWGIRTNIVRYELADAMSAPHDLTMKLAGIKTRLGRMPRVSQERLVNWGYAVCDAGMRRHVEQGPAPAGFPYPDAGVG
jgi:NTE family protein